MFWELWQNKSTDVQIYCTHKYIRDIQTSRRRQHGLGYVTFLRCISNICCYIFAARYTAIHIPWRESHNSLIPIDYQSNTNSIQLEHERKHWFTTPWRVRPILLWSYIFAAVDAPHCNPHPWRVDTNWIIFIWNTLNTIAIEIQIIPASTPNMTGRG